MALMRRVAGGRVQDVRTAVAARLRESQGQGGMDSLADPHRHKRQTTMKLADRRPAAPAAFTVGCWTPADEAAAASTANGVAEAAQAVTSQKEAEPGSGGGAYTLDDWIAFRHAFSDGQVDAAGIHAEFRRMKAGKQHFVEELVKTKSADQLRLMAMQHGHYDARRNTKPQNAESLYRTLPHRVHAR